MGICYVCGKEVDFPFRCNYCNLTFCDDHRLPEQHSCVNLPKRSEDERDLKGLRPSTSRRSMLRESRRTEKGLMPRSEWKETMEGWRNEGERTGYSRKMSKKVVLIPIAMLSVGSYFLVPEVKLFVDPFIEEVKKTTFFVVDFLTFLFKRWTGEIKI